MNITRYRKEIWLIIIPSLIIFWVFFSSNYFSLLYFTPYGAGSSYITPIFIFFCILTILYLRVLFKAVQEYQESNWSKIISNIVKIIAYETIGLLVAYACMNAYFLMDGATDSIYFTYFFILVAINFVIGSILLIVWSLINLVSLTFKKIAKRKQVSPLLFIGIPLVILSLIFESLIVLGVIGQALNPFTY